MKNFSKRIGGMMEKFSGIGSQNEPFIESVEVNNFYGNSYRMNFGEEVSTLGFLIAPNGYGKSFIMKAICYMINRDEDILDEIKKIKVDSIVVHFSDGSVVSMNGRFKISGKSPIKYARFIDTGSMSDFDLDKALFSFTHDDRMVDDFIQIVNDSFELTKIKASVDRKRECAEIVFTDKDGKKVSVHKLSKGMKALVYLYACVFIGDDTDGRIAKDGDGVELIFIDEPEVFWHIKWQRDFPYCIDDVAEKRGVQVVVATHSPDIVNGRQDLFIEWELVDHADADDHGEADE